MEDGRIQTALTVASVAFAVAVLAPALEGGMTIDGKPVVPLILIGSSILATCCAMIYMRLLAARDALRSYGDEIAVGAMEVGVWLLMLGLLMRLIEFMR